ncbi:UNVERIFIED_CONTAM: hypothetical protein Sindi_3029600 [Sesamum indicum]
MPETYNIGDDDTMDWNGSDVPASTGCAWENNYIFSAGDFAQQQRKPDLAGGFEKREPDLAGGFAQQKREPDLASTLSMELTIHYLHRVSTTYGGRGT